MLWMRINKKADTYRKQETAALGGFLAELPNFLATFAACLLTGSLIVWADFISSAQSTLHYGIVLTVSHRLKGDMADRYNYGIERIDIFASLVCDFLMIVGFIGLVGYGVYGFIHIEAVPDNLYLFLILKLLNIAFDVFFVVQQWVIRRKTRSKINETELTACVSYLLDDAVTMAVAIIAYFFRSVEWIGYLVPAYCVGSGVYFAFSCAKHIRASIGELTDRALPIAQQDAIVDLLLARKGCFRCIHAVNSRVINGEIQIALNIEFFPETTYHQQTEFLRGITSDIRRLLGESTVSLIQEGVPEVPGESS